jgi:predicted Fe-Mo cluster-binding NifX family protein
MNICMPVENDNGLSSHVCAHFGSAPLFMIVNTESGGCRAIQNVNMHHGHGMCQPLATLRGEKLDAIVVGGIGMGALNKLMASGLKVYQAAHPTVAETLNAFKSNTLREVTPGMACAHHGHDHH